ncbi:MAG: DNA adenine methylase [Streptosporangiaceae bacterium]
MDAREAAREPAARAAFGWYGSKARLAPKIAAMAEGIPHRVYVEPYAGSAAVLFAKPRAPVEIINDLDGQVVNFFRVLRDHPAALARACQLTPYSRDEYHAGAAGHDGLSELDQARRFWARCCQGFNNAGAGRRAGWAISTAPGSNEARSAAGLAAQLEAIAGRLAGVYVEHADALEVITRYAAPDVLIYADPVYLAETRTGRARSRQGDYQHECDRDHHRALAAVLRGTAAAVLVSGYGHPLYRELYAGWHRTEIRVTKPSGNHSATAARHVTEVIWSNRPADSGSALFPLTGPGIRDETMPATAETAPPRDETPARETGKSCQVCGQPVRTAATGRPRSYCSRACQARAYRARKQACAGPPAR